MRPVHAVRGLAFTLVLVAGSSTVADDSGEEVKRWLDRMARAVETLDYRGTLVHWHDGQLDTLGIVHRADENGIRERIYSLDGPVREILRDGNKIRCLMADDQPLVIQSQLAARLMPNLPLGRMGSPETAYDMRMGKRERVAGMMARIIEVMPRDHYRYGHRLWLEEQTGMLLRSALLDYNDRTLQQLSFVSVELGARISDAELQATLDESAAAHSTLMPVTARSRMATNQDRPSWSPESLPAYFRMARAGTHKTGAGERFEHLVFSDGLASFSIYIEPGRPGYHGTRLESIGPVHVLTGLTDERKITIVGEVPRATVELVGRSLRRSAAALSRR
jgi:sigma-E factor negative regulatory protein RseB